MENLFSIKYGHIQRETFILNMFDKDPSIALILAAVTFEWTLKRFILKLGKSNTSSLRDKLEKTWSYSNLKQIWHDEIGSQYKNTAIKDVLHQYSNVMVPSKDPKNPNACDVRGRLIHGNGTVSLATADKAMTEYLFAARFLHDYAESKHRKNLDTRLVSRR